MAELDNDILGENTERSLIHDEDNVKLPEHKVARQDKFRKWCNLTYDPFSASRPYGMVSAKYYGHMVGAPKSVETPTTRAFYCEVHDTLKRILTIMTNRWILLAPDDHPFTVSDGGVILMGVVGMDFRIEHRPDMEFPDTGVTFGHFHDSVCEFMGTLGDHLYNLRPVSMVRSFNAIGCLPSVEAGDLPLTGTHVGEHPPPELRLSPN